METARTQPVGQRRGGRSVFVARTNCSVRGKKRIAAMDQILADEDSQLEMAEAVVTQVRRNGRTKKVELEELMELGVVELEEVRRPAAWADRTSPSGLVVVMPDQGPNYQVWTESRLEHDHLRLIAGDRELKEFATQPLAFEWVNEGFATMHIPDVLVRVAGDAPPLLIDCRAEHQRDKLNFQVHVALTGQVARLLGWTYELWGKVPPILAANMQVLAAHGAADDDTKEVVEQLACAAGRDFRTVGGFLRAAWNVRYDAAGALYHALWTGRLEVDLLRPIRMWTPIKEGLPDSRGIALPTVWRERIV
jgi:hypothetical protein